MNNIKIIDFHTHTFPDHVAERAVKKLELSSGLRSYAPGTDSALSENQKKDGIDLSVVLPVATKPGQAEKINRTSLEKNEKTGETGLLYFGAIHPGDENKRTLLKNIKSAGFAGIKLHPVFQNIAIDDPANLEIMDAASELGLITVIHAGFDVSYPGNNLAGVEPMLRMLETVHPENTVLAHMGGWNQWDLVEKYLAGADVYFDTAYTLNPLREIPDHAMTYTGARQLTNEQFVRIVKKHGAEKIIFGSDNPWSGQAESLNGVLESGLSETDLKLILSENALKLL